MVNHIWLPRPKRQLTPVPAVLGVFAKIALGQEWSGNHKLQVAIEEGLEEAGVKRSGGRRLKKTATAGSGARTYFSWMVSLGLIFLDRHKRLYFTLAGEAILKGESPFKILKHQIVRHQIPSAFSKSSGVQINSRFRIHPFIFILKVLSDTRIKTLTEEEIAKVILIEAESDSDKCLEHVIQRILAFRNYNDAILESNFVEKYSSSRSKNSVNRIFSKLNDVANTMVNWLLYARLIERDNAGHEKGIMSILNGAEHEVASLIQQTWKFIPYPEDQELFQRAYGVTPWQRKDVRDLEKASNVTAKMIQERTIKSAFLTESLKKPITTISSEIITLISEKTSIEENIVEDILNKNYAYGAIGGFMSSYFEMAFSGHDKCIEFEKATNEIFNNIFKFNSKHIAGGAKEVPDVLIMSDSAGYQAIIDTKAYSRYDLGAAQRDRMIHHYIPDIHKYGDCKLPLAFFSYISGGFSDTIETPLKKIVDTTHINGCAMPVSTFIKMAEHQLETPYSHDEIRRIFSLNRKTLLSDVVSQ